MKAVSGNEGQKILMQNECGGKGEGQRKVKETGGEMEQQTQSRTTNAFTIRHFSTAGITAV